MKEAYLIAIQDVADGNVSNVLCETLVDLQKFINNVDTAAYTILNISPLPSFTNGWADFCSKNTNLERG